MFGFVTVYFKTEIQPTVMLKSNFMWQILVDKSPFTSGTFSRDKRLECIEAIPQIDVSEEHSPMPVDVSSSKQGCFMILLVVLDALGVVWLVCCQPAPGAGGPARR